mgnify:CR=1 FL=1
MRSASPSRPRPMPAGVSLLTGLFAISLLAPRPASAGGPFKTDRQVRAVVLGGSISMYYAGNYGQYLQHGCRNLEVVNRAKVGAGGAALVKRFDKVVAGDPALARQLAGRETWLLFQGGLNSVYAPSSTSLHLSRLFKRAHEAGMQVMAWTLTPWGDESDRRFAGFEGVKTVRDTRHVNAFLLGSLSPDEALGRAGKGHPHEWLKGELPDISVDVFNSNLRDSGASERPTAALEQGFGRSRYRKEATARATIISEARAVPRNFMRPTFRDFDHTHPNTRGHRLMALAACRRAPASWGCDCDRIARAVFSGHVRDPKGGEGKGKGKGK